MRTQTEALQYIRTDYKEFADKLANFFSTELHDPAKLADLLDCFYRLRERYKKERSCLAKEAQKILDKPFFDNVLTEGLLKLRVVSSHKAPTPGVTIHNEHGQPAELTCELSGGAVTSKPTLTFWQEPGIEFTLRFKAQFKAVDPSIAKALTEAETIGPINREY